MCYIAAKYEYKNVVGVEHSARLVSTARHNVSQMPVFSSKITLFLRDAAAADLPKGPRLVFIFNSFGTETFRKFMALNQASFLEETSFLLLANDHLLDEALKWGKLVKRNWKLNLSVVDLFSNGG